ncbi:hypothetical protein V7x_13020 [Crateriforma conspicua]|uniref:Uncharacterized protein n=1 Tax=Crateriforma conspicua TaxID=2527996 RepID=A0A5C6FXH9_9PLAN|nr:hypothetical protein V7x_13020 [Crateriforma conspicua]
MRPHRLGVRETVPVKPARLCGLDHQSLTRTSALTDPTLQQTRVSIAAPSGGTTHRTDSANHVHMVTESTLDWQTKQRMQNGLDGSLWTTSPPTNL